MPLKEHHSHRSNMKCHNLYRSAPHLTTMEKLVGLGSEFCLQLCKLNLKDFKSMTSRFENDKRVKYCVKHSLGKITRPMPKFHVKINSLNLPKAPSTIEGALL